MVSKKEIIVTEKELKLLEAFSYFIVEEKREALRKLITFYQQKNVKGSDLELPQYERSDDVYWEVRRQYCNVSNRTYSPVDEWDGASIKAAVNNLDVAITNMLKHQSE